MPITTTEAVEAIAILVILGLSYWWLGKQPPSIWPGRKR